MYRRLAIAVGLMLLLGAGLYLFRSLPEQVGPYHMGHR
jgi:hypothetical protein